MSTLEVKAIQAPTGYKLAMPAGHILQVVQSNSASDPSVTSTTLVDSGHSVTITPSSTSAKVFVVFTFNAHVAGSGYGLKYALYRDSTKIGDEGIVYNSATNHHHIVAQQFLDSPSSASPVVYKIYFASYSGASVRMASDWGHTIMTAMEIQG